MRIADCRLCGANEPAPFLAPSSRLDPDGNPELVRCLRCGLVYAAAVPVVEALALQYDKSYYDEVLGSTCTEGSASSIARYYASLLKQLETYHPCAQLLDLGCATGDFLVAARKRGWATTGIEVSAFAAQRARERGLNVLTGSLESVSSQLGKYDVVTVWEVLEHLPDPLNELRRVRDLLAPGGLLALSTPNVYGLSTSVFGRRSVIFKPSEHLTYFSQRTLAHILSAAGFRVVLLKSHLVFLTNFLLAWPLRGRAPEQQPLPVSRIAPAQKSLYGALWRGLHGTRVGALGVAGANVILNRLGLGDGLVAFAELAD